MRCWECLPARFVCEDGKTGVRSDDGTLAFLSDDRGVRGRGEFSEVDSHTDAGDAGGGTPGGVAGGIS